MPNSIDHLHSGFIPNELCCPSIYVRCMRMRVVSVPRCLFMGLIPIAVRERLLFDQ